MEVKIIPHGLQGTITPPPSKSQAHRLIIAAALSEGDCIISNVAFSKDILATLDAMKQLGARWEKRDDHCILVKGVRSGAPILAEDGLPHIDCGESGSTLRFLIPIALAVAGGGVFTGRGRLMERPQKPYFDLFDEKGIAYAQENGELMVRGQLKSGPYALAGDVSSQFFTGLLYALSLSEGESIIQSTTTLESRSYIDMTIDALREFGVAVAEVEGEYPAFCVKGGQRYCARDCSVEADWSQAGFYYAAKGIGNEIEMTGMNAYSVQGDMKIVPYYLKMLQSGDVELDVSDCPDLVPPLAVQAALRGKGNITRIVNAARLRIKESDRLTAVTTVLNALGAHIEELPDGLVIYGRDALEGGVTVDPFNDHRIAMMTAMAATRCRRPVTVLNAECVQKSYPDFWEDYERLGGAIRREAEV
ncbi:MAG: 3-phosphoshikimate 1-carboxyvinyltransferase [Oscillospiraceae bacterium]|nr:3-phosphoshikimate 1-carboxyvinyltransferase [Oscillospiraceae bacterium]